MTMYLFNNEVNKPLLAHTKHDIKYFHTEKLFLSHLYSIIYKVILIGNQSTIDNLPCNI